MLRRKTSMATFEKAPRPADSAVAVDRLVTGFPIRPVARRVSPCCLGTIDHGLDRPSVSCLVYDATADGNAVFCNVSVERMLRR